MIRPSRRPSLTLWTSQKVSCCQSPDPIVPFRVFCGDIVVLPRLKWFCIRWAPGPGFGTNFTLACPYTILAHYDDLAWAEECGVDAVRAPAVACARERKSLR
jgi:hypothetical protein